MPKVSTAVDERGLRTHDKDGHRIAWFAPARLQPGNYGSHPHGQCSAGHWWIQDGRHALTQGSEPLHGGTFHLDLDLQHRTGEGVDVVARLRVSCAGSHVKQRYGGSNDEFGEPRSADELLAVRDRLVAEGWRFIWREASRGEAGARKLDVLCPRCVAEWSALESELAQLKEAAGASLI